MLVRLPELMSGPTPRDIRVLFVCHHNRRRSATAERVFAKDSGLEVRSAGTSPDALVPVNQRMLDWADIVFVMDDEQHRALMRAFPGHAAPPRAVVLHVKDDYHFLDPELISELREKVTPHLDRLRADEAR
jgi:protein-tyrosine phosphatase